jgi:threonine/homoserine/homoserine lactone efflux protein
MADLHALTAYVLIVLGLFLIPGPAVLLTLARAASGGWRVGIATGLGIATGDLVHALCAVLGLSALLMTSALAFDAVKFLGVLYLLYLGVRAFLERPQPLHLPTVQRLGSARAFRQGVFTEVLNPKTALFFLAFLPQFVQAGRGSVALQLTVLGLLFVVLSVLYTTLLALGGGAVAGWLSRHPWVGQHQGKVIGAVYLALGLRLAFEER